MDTGPLVAYFCAGEARHAWAVHQFENLAPPILTCEPVLTETCFLLGRAKQPASQLLDKVRQGALQIGVHLEDEAGPVIDPHAPLSKSADVPRRRLPGQDGRDFRVTDLYFGFRFRGLSWAPA
jgi:hypothetical protein